MRPRIPVLLFEGATKYSVAMNGRNPDFVCTVIFGKFLNVRRPVFIFSNDNTYPEPVSLTKPPLNGPWLPTMNVTFSMKAIFFPIKQNQFIYY